MVGRRKKTVESAADLMKVKTDRNQKGVTGHTGTLLTKGRKAHSEPGRNRLREKRYGTIAKSKKKGRNGDNRAIEEGSHGVKVAA